jgi:hypothetical protein
MRRNASHPKSDKRPLKKRGKARARLTVGSDDDDYDDDDEDKKDKRVLCLFDVPGEGYCARDLHRGSLKLHIVKKHLGGDDDAYDEGVHAKMYVKKGDVVKRKLLGLLEVSMDEGKIMAKLEDMQMQLNTMTAVLNHIALKVKIHRG